jgi:hypothetical protein
MAEEQKMSERRFPTIPALAALAAAALWLTAVLPASATVRSMPLHGAQVVNVSVGFNTQVPLADLSEETLAATQKAGREFIYRMARDECAVLEAIIAETCRLTNLNISTQLQRHNPQNPVMLYINGNATFAIGLKSGEAE